MDAESKIPLPGVYISPYSKSDKDANRDRICYSDSNGHFQYQAMGMFSEFSLYFERSDCKIREVSFKGMSENDTVYLEKLK